MKNIFLKKSCVAGIIIIFIGISIIPTTGTIFYKTLYQPEIVYVDDDFDENTSGWGVDHFDNIQAGVNAVKLNGTVEVYNGVYYENVNIGKSLKLNGEDYSMTIIDGMNISEVVYINADYVEISGFTIINGETGITSAGGHTTITGNLITDNYNYGINLGGLGEDNIISKNTISNNGHSLPSGNKSSYGGIALTLSVQNRIYNNNFYNNSDFHAFFFKSILNLWILNYWDRARLLPYPILGLQAIIPPMFWVQFDLRPRLTPYPM